MGTPSCPPPHGVDSVVSYWYIEFIHVVANHWRNASNINEKHSVSYTSSVHNFSGQALTFLPQWLEAVSGTK